MLEFYKGKRVLVTGHTGFKGSWLCKILSDAGAEITGFALQPSRDSLYYIAGIGNEIRSIYSDIRDYENLKEVFDESKPEIVFHLAAQPIVRESYKNPRYTYETNVMGTVNVLECIRNTKSVQSFLNVTTDKVYKNREWIWGYREEEELNGIDPYSSSKSCSELVTGSYQASFFTDSNGRMTMPISTARAGNVIGGGDFAMDRIIPDCVRAACENRKIIVRNPYSIRPYQHVLEPLYVYLLIAEQQFKDITCAGNYNVGPDEQDCIETGKLVDLFIQYWGENLEWKNEYDGGPHEANYLKLDCSKLKHMFGWKPKWNVEESIKNTVQWYKTWAEGGDVKKCMEQQIENFLYTSDITD